MVCEVNLKLCCSRSFNVLTENSGSVSVPYRVDKNIAMK